MTDFAQGLIDNGEESQSIRILLETHWPELAGRAELGWLEYLARQGTSKELIENFTHMEGHQEDAVDPGRSEYKAITREGDHQTAQRIVDGNATLCNPDFGMLRDLCHSYKVQRADKMKRQLEEGVIIRVQVAGVPTKGDRGERREEARNGSREKESHGPETRKTSNTLSEFQPHSKGSNHISKAMTTSFYGVEELEALQRKYSDYDGS